MPGTGGLPATRAQIGKIKEQYHRLGCDDRITQLSYTSEILDGKSLDSHNRLKRTEAHKVIETLLAKDGLG